MIHSIDKSHNKLNKKGESIDLLALGLCDLKRLPLERMHRQRVVVDSISLSDAVALPKIVDECVRCLVP